MRRLGRRLPAPAQELAKDILVRWPKPRWGNLKRHVPFSVRAGFDRGTPVDRYYIERFLARHTEDVAGRVLEVRDSRYTRRFGGAKVSESTILDIDPANPSATLVADLGEPKSLPERRFDCVVLTQVLEYVQDVDVALANVARALAPGGTAFVTVPTLQGIDLVEKVDDLWRWTPVGLRRTLERVCPNLRAEIEGHGNLVAALAFLHGLAAEELAAADLEREDPRYVIVTCARLAAA